MNSQMLDITPKAINQTVYKIKSKEKWAEKEMSVNEKDIDLDSIERESLLGSAHTVARDKYTVPINGQPQIIQSL